MKEADSLLRQPQQDCAIFFILEIAHQVTLSCGEGCRSYVS